MQELFEIRHPDIIKYNFLQLKGHSLGEAEELVSRQLRMVQNALDTELVEPNCGDGQNHVFKISASLSSFQKGGRVPQAILKMLGTKKYDFKDILNGNFLVRFQIK